MKLFRVEVTKVIYMFAEDERMAELDGPMHAEEDVGYEDVSVSEATELKYVDKEWQDSVPFGGDRDELVTVREFFERPEEPKPYVDPPEQQRLWQ